MESAVLWGRRKEPGHSLGYGCTEHTTQPCGPPLAHCPKGPSGSLIQLCCSGPPWLHHRTNGSLSCQRSEFCLEGGPQHLGRPSQTEIPHVSSEQGKGAMGQEMESRHAARLQSPEFLSAPRRVGGQRRRAVGRMAAKESRSVSWGGVPLCGPPFTPRDSVSPSSQEETEGWGKPYSMLDPNPPLSGQA